MIFKLLQNATRIGVAGFSMVDRALLESAAAQVAAEKGGRITLVWIAGVRDVEVDAQLIAKSSAVPRGRCPVEEEISFLGLTAADAMKVARNAIALLLERVS